MAVYSYFSEYYTFIACWWGKYENLFTQEYHIPWGKHPRGIWYSWVNKFSYFLNPYTINVLLYRMKPRKHIHVKYCWKAYLEHCLRHLKTTSTTSDAFRVPLTFSYQKTITLAWKPASLRGDWIWFLFHGIWFLSCVITCSDIYLLSNQINLFMVINIWGIILGFIYSGMSKLNRFWLFC